VGGGKLEKTGRKVKFMQFAITAQGAGV